MSSPASSREEPLPLEAMLRLDAPCQRFEAAWQAGQRPDLEAYLGEVGEEDRPALLGELLVLELVYRHRAGEAPRAEDYLGRFPAHADLIHKAFTEAISPASPAQPPASGSSTPDQGRQAQILPPPPLTVDEAEGVPCLADTVVPTEVPGYEVLDELGHGGMGVVYRARQLSANRIVALKVIRADRLQELDPEERPKWVARFRWEAEAVATLDHPHIVPLYEVCEHGEQPYFSMRLVEGGSLLRRLEQFREDPRAAARLVAVVARALHHAHQRQILHRDLKPHNILIDSDGQPHVTDFGLARRIGAARAGLSSAGGVIGTPEYMAPEQVRAERDLTTAVDVYGLGAVLYHLLTGRPPHGKESLHQTLLSVLEAEPTRPRALNPKVEADLETICLKCLAKAPRERYGSTQAVAEDLEHWLRGEPVQARRTGLGEQVLMWARRRPGLALMAGVAAVFFLLSSVLGASYALTANHLAVETKLRGVAERAEQRAEAALYANRVFRAYFEWHDDQSTRADQLLSECPTGLRHWEWNYVKRLCHSELLVLMPVGGIRAVAFGPDGKRLAVVGRDGVVRVWDAATGEETSSLPAWEGAFAEVGVFALSYSPDGKRLAGVGGDGVVRVWDAATGRNVSTVKMPTDLYFTSTALSPDGRLLAGGYTTGEIRVWDVITGKETFTSNTASRSIVSLAFSSDGKRLATVSMRQDSRGLDPVDHVDHAVEVWNLGTGQRLLYLDGNPSWMGSVAFSPDGRRIAGAEHHGGVRVWEVTTGRELLHIRGNMGGVLGVAFSPDGRHLAGAGRDKVVRVWGATTGQMESTFKGHTASVTGLVFSRDGRRLASVSTDGTARMWDMAASQDVLVFNKQMTYVNSVTFSPDGSRLATVSENKVEVWDTATGLQDFAIKGYSGSPYAAYFSPDGRRLATVTLNRMRVYDMVSGKEVFAAGEHEGQVVAAHFSLDGRRLTCANTVSMVVWVPGPPPSQRDIQELRVWDATTGQEAFAKKGRFLGKPCVFSPDGARLAGIDDTGLTHVWDTATGKEITTTGIPSGRSTCLAFSPDGRRLAGGGDDGRVRVWDIGTSREVFALPSHKGGVSFVTFSPGGTHLVSVGNDVAVVRDAATGQEAFQLKADDDRIHHVAFSPDGRRLAWAGDNGVVQIWDIATAKETVALKAAGFFVSCLNFSPDSKRLASASGDGMVRIWDLTTHQAMRTLEVDAAESQHAWLSSAVSQDGKTLARVDPDGAVRLWDTATGQATLVLTGLKGLDAVDAVLAYSANSQRLATVTFDRRAVRVWDTVTGKEVYAFEGVAGDTNDWRMVFSSDGKRLAGAVSGGVLRVWDVAAGREELSIKWFSDHVFSMAFSPDGGRLAGAGDDGTVRVLDVATGRVTLAVDTHATAVAFSHDGNYLVTSGLAEAVFVDGNYAGEAEDRVKHVAGARSVQVWDVSTGKEVLEIKASVGPVSFSPDGRRLVAAGADGIVHLWDMATGLETLSLKGHGEGESHVAFSPDGTRIICVNHRVRSVLIWDATPLADRLSTHPISPKP
jgi:WD40 repeat protein/tRNA A-37 threonylcarbamoyl transferase component Bud32